MTQRQTWRRRDGGKGGRRGREKFTLTSVDTLFHQKWRKTSTRHWCWGSHITGLQLLQEHLFPGCFVCYFSAANRIKPRSDQLSRDRICTLGWVQRQRTERYPLEGILRARVSVQQRTREGSDVLWCSSQPVPFSSSVFKLLAKFVYFFYFFSPF